MEQKREEWKWDDPLQYTIPKPNVEEGEMWGILLKPLLEKDQIKCDAWNDEVQNLLIFAGLFSAVVTGFVIDSYKRLQPDPNDAIISLLSQIASGKINSTSTADPAITAMTSFKPTPSSIRINSFWFLSLILSLTTVLVGIISLQWIREHRSYPGLSPKETFAVFHMRSDGLKKWHVDNILASLPLLLELALILFFIGIADFLFSLGHYVAVFVPITILIGLTLLFLISTTVLPALQGYCLYLPFFYKRNIPSQCPYKSPQSQAFGEILQIILRIFLRDSLIHRIQSSVPEHLTTPFELVASAVYQINNWTDHDMVWLFLRDLKYFSQITSKFNWHNVQRISSLPKLPLLDSVRGIQSALSNHNKKWTEYYLAAYHCLEHLSSERGKDTRNSCIEFKVPLPIKNSDRVHEKLYFTEHFWSLLSDFDAKNSIFFPDFFDEPLPNTTAELDLFNFQKIEIFTRLLTYTFNEKRILASSALDLDIPSCIATQTYFPTDVEDLYSQYGTILSTFFQQCSTIRLDVIENTIHIHPGIPSFLYTASQTFLNAIDRADPKRKIYLNVFHYISATLDNHTASMAAHDYKPDVLFYNSAVFMNYLTVIVDYFDILDPDNLKKKRLYAIHPFISALSAIHRYYRTNGTNTFLENRLNEKHEQHGEKKFTPDWWDFSDPSRISLITSF